MRYYILSTPGGNEVARLKGGTASYFEAQSGRWVPDPLLAVEVLAVGEWRRVEPHELPAGVTEVVVERPRVRRSRRLKRGRRKHK